MNDSTTIDMGELSDRQARVALRLLLIRRTRKEARLKVRTKELKNAVDSARGDFDEAISEDIPDIEDDWREHIRSLRKSEIDAEAKRKREVSEIRATIAQIQHAMDELALDEPTDQMPLDFDNNGEPSEDEANMTTATATAVQLALTEAIDEGMPENDDLASLKNRLTELGVDGMKLSDEPDAPDEEGD